MSIVALRYAHAFAQVAEGKHLDLNAARQQLHDFAETLSSSHELREVLLNPSIPQDQKLRVIDAIAARLGMFREARNLIAVIMDHQRLDSFQEIVAAYDQIADADSGIAEAEIVSAHPLNNEDRAALEAEVAKLAGGRVRASYREDATLLGGAVVRIGSTIYDGSIRSQLHQLKERLINA